MNIKIISLSGIRRWRFLLFLFVVSSLFVGADSAPLQKIVVFKKSFDKISSQDLLVINSGATKIKSLKLINGMAAHMSPQTERLLKKRDEILRIDDDLVIHASQNQSSAKGKKPQEQPPQVFPWNMLMINAPLAWADTTGAAVNVAVLDTGVDLDHPDLFQNIKGQINIIKPKKTGDDDSGHGTHVAGIVAAADNAIGVIGVGPDISLYAVKVLDKKQRGKLSDLIDALDWCIDNGMHVVNMSLGSLQDNLSFQEAIESAYLAGLTLVASAGNYGLEGGVMTYPARYDETIAVTSVDQFGNLDPYSSWGSAMDLAAPGVDVHSTFKDGLYALMSGTSMAAPHVTGTVALILCTTPTADFDGNNNQRWDPSEILLKLKSTAQPLGYTEEQQGAGLVRVFEAIRQ